MPSRRHAIEPRRRAGFTLIELVTVVLILGILVGVAMPRLLDGNRDADIEATISHLKTIATAAEIAYNQTGAWPADSRHGDMPPELADYLRPNLFDTPCPVGGRYDWDNGSISGFDVAISIYELAPDRSLWNEIDRRIDDGDLSAGWVRSPGGRRLSLVIE